MTTILQPLSIDDIVYGKRYLFAELWYNHGFCTNINPIIFAEKLPTDFIGERARVILKGKTQERYLESFGLITEKRSYFHRVFENTRENFDQLVLDMEGPLPYLMAIGYSQKDALAEISKKKNGPKSH